MTTAAVVTDDLRRAEAWFDRVQPPYAVLVDHTRNIARAFGVYKLLGFDSLNMARPSAFIVDRRLEVRFARVFAKDAPAPDLEEYLKIIPALSAGASV